MIDLIARLLGAGYRPEPIKDTPDLRKTLLEAANEIDRLRDVMSDALSVMLANNSHLPPAYSEDNPIDDARTIIVERVKTALFERAEEKG